MATSSWLMKHSHFSSKGISAGGTDWEVELVILQNEGWDRMQRVWWALPANNRKSFRLPEGSPEVVICWHSDLQCALMMFARTLCQRLVGQRSRTKALKMGHCVRSAWQEWNWREMSGALKDWSVPSGAIWCQAESIANILLMTMPTTSFIRQRQPFASIHATECLQTVKSLGQRLSSVTGFLQPFPLWLHHTRGHCN